MVKMRQSCSSSLHGTVNKVSIFSNSRIFLIISATCDATLFFKETLLKLILLLMLLKADILRRTKHNYIEANKILLQTHIVVYTLLLCFSTF